MNVRRRLSVMTWLRGARETQDSVAAGLDDRAGAADHVVEVGTGGDHRVDRVLLLDAEVDDDGPGGGARRRDRVLDLLAAGDAQAGQAVSLGELDEVRTAQRRRRVAA